MGIYKQSWASRSIQTGLDTTCMSKTCCRVTGVTGRKSLHQCFPEKGPSLPKGAQLNGRLKPEPGPAPAGSFVHIYPSPVQDRGEEARLGQIRVECEGQQTSEWSSQSAAGRGRRGQTGKRKPKLKPKASRAQSLARGAGLAGAGPEPCAVKEQASFPSLSLSSLCFPAHHHSLHPLLLSTPLRPSAASTLRGSALS